jgi:hypothetical protein
MSLTKIKVHISSCVQGESFYGHELKRIALLSSKYVTEFIEEPEDADVIFIVDIDESNLFKGLRCNPVWKKYPDKSFGMYEGDHAPPFLHGLYSDARKSRMNANRYLGLPYKMHQICFPNPVPDISLVKAIPKNLLFSFAGRMSHKIRQELLKNTYPNSEVQLVDTSTYNHFQIDSQNRVESQETYWQLAMRSKYVLCPRGAAASSVRLFEIMEAGIAPVIISDDWIAPYGPNWKDFAIFIPERKMKHLYSIIKAHENEWEIRGKKARESWEIYYTDSKYWDFCQESIEFIKQNQSLGESFFTKIFPLLLVQKYLIWYYFKLIILCKAFAKKILYH